MRVKKRFYADTENGNPILVSFKENKKGEITNKIYESKIYLGVIVDYDKVNDSYSYDIAYDIESFVKLFQNEKYNNSIIYFHNLSYDASFIEYYCIKNNIKYSKIMRKGELYRFKLFKVELRDSYKLLPITLKELGESFNKKYFKTSIDYDVDFEHKATKEEIDYCINDCLVLAEGLENFYDELEKLMKDIGLEDLIKEIYSKLSISSISFLIGTAITKKNNKYLHTLDSSWHRSYKNGYHGGLVYSGDKKLHTNVLMLDENSEHPYCYTKLELPYGRPIPLFDFEDRKNYGFYVCKVSIKFSLKKNWKIPFITQGNAFFSNANYLESSNNEYIELVLTSIDLECIERYYDCDYEFIWCDAFLTKNGIYKEFGEEFYNLKVNSKGAKKIVVKRILNSFYGKLAMSGETDVLETTIDENGLLKDDIIDIKDNKKMYKYIVQAMAITAHAMKNLLLGCEIIEETFGIGSVLYCDTDSIKFDTNGMSEKQAIDLLKSKGMRIDDKELGAFKNEGFCDFFKTIAPKKYIYAIKNSNNNYNISITCAGFKKAILFDVLTNNIASVKQGGDDLLNVEKKEFNKDSTLSIIAKFKKGFKMMSTHAIKCIGGRAVIAELKEIK